MTSHELLMNHMASVNSTTSSFGGPQTATKTDELLKMARLRRKTTSNGNEDLGTFSDRDGVFSKILPVNFGFDGPA